MYCYLYRMFKQLVSVSLVEREKPHVLCQNGWSEERAVLVWASPEVWDAWRGADSCSGVDNQVLGFFYQLGERLHLRLQLLRIIKRLPQNRKHQV